MLCTVCQSIFTPALSHTSAVETTRAFLDTSSEGSEAVPFYDARGRLANDLPSDSPSPVWPGFKHHSPPALALSALQGCALCSRLHAQLVFRPMGGDHTRLQDAIGYGCLKRQGTNNNGILPESLVLTVQYYEHGKWDDAAAQLGVYWVWQRLYPMEEDHGILLDPSSRPRLIGLTVLQVGLRKSMRSAAISQQQRWSNI